MAKAKFPVTPAVRALRAAKATYEPHLFDYVERGGTAASSAALGVDEHQVIKTLVMERAGGEPLIVLMHGDRAVATGVLAKALGAKKVRPVAPALAQKLTGYQVGGTSPFGLARPLEVYAESTIAPLERLLINGGKRGFLVSMSGRELERLLAPTWVEVAQPRS